MQQNKLHLQDLLYSQDLFIEIFKFAYSNNGDEWTKLLNWIYSDIASGKLVISQGANYHRHFATEVARRIWDASKLKPNWMLEWNFLLKDPRIKNKDTTSNPFAFVEDTTFSEASKEVQKYYQDKSPLDETIEQQLFVKMATEILLYLQQQYDFSLIDPNVGKRLNDVYWFLQKTETPFISYHWWPEALMLLRPNHLNSQAIIERVIVDLLEVNPHDSKTVGDYISQVRQKLASSYWSTEKLNEQDLKNFFVAYNWVQDSKVREKIRSTAFSFEFHLFDTDAGRHGNDYDVQAQPELRIKALRNTVNNYIDDYKENPLVEIAKAVSEQALGEIFTKAFQTKDIEKISNVEWNKNKDKLINTLFECGNISATASKVIKEHWKQLANIEKYCGR